MTEKLERKEELLVMIGCDCVDNCLVHTEYDRHSAPVIKTVLRNGKQMNVCSRCDLKTDKIIKWLVTKKHPFKAYFDYDPFVIGLGEQIPQ